MYALTRKQSLQKAVRQIERWLYAASQDISPGITMLHANYAVGNLDMLRQMYSDRDIERATGKSAFKLLHQASKLQDKAQRELLRLCPQ